MSIKTGMYIYYYNNFVETCTASIQVKSIKIKRYRDGNKSLETRLIKFMHTVVKLSKPPALYHHII